MADRKELIACSECGKMVKRQGMGSHKRMMHQMTPEQRAAQSTLAGRNNPGHGKGRTGPRETLKRVAKEPVVQIEPVVEPAPSALDADDALVVLGKVRRLLGEDPQVAQLTGQVTGLAEEVIRVTQERDEATKRVEELETKLASLRLVFDQ